MVQINTVSIVSAYSDTLKYLCFGDLGQGLYLYTRFQDSTQ